MQDTLELELHARRAEPLLRLLERTAPTTGLADHSKAVGCLARRIAHWLGLPGETAERLYLAGQLHDIGKLAVPEEILCKPGALTEEEWILIRRHPETGWRYLRRVGLAEEAEWVLMHHERPDGAGYPSRLTAGEIAQEATILAVADSYTAMTDDRIHQAGMSEAEALAEVRRCSGSQFAPHVVDALVEMTASPGESAGSFG